MVWTGSGPLWGPLLEDFMLFMPLLLNKASCFYLFLSVLFGWAMWGPFCCNLGMSNVLYTFIPNGVLFIVVIQFLGCYIMNHVLRDCICKFVVVYFDDILVYSTSSQLHVSHLRVVLSLL